MAQPDYPRWADLLVEAVNTPGRLHEAYRFFYVYSIANQCLAISQCHSRHIPLGPIATVKKWNERGRRVRRGQKALVLCRPILVTKRQAEGSVADEDGATERSLRFTYRPMWFAISQTEADPAYTGPVYEQPAPPDWEMSRAFAGLQIREIHFADLNGNTQGYSYPERRELAINPVALYPWKTTFHELAHIILQHGDHGHAGEQEVEAELTAYLLTDTLQVDLAARDSARAYCQHYLRGGTLTEGMAQRTFRAANAILEAGYDAARASEAA